jgi:hypothetical protein
LELEFEAEVEFEVGCEVELAPEDVVGDGFVFFVVK